MIFKCKMCGGDIEPIENTNTGKCLYCKSIMTLPNLDDEKIVNLYNRANDLRLFNEFDKAYQVYETILEIDNKEVEAHWGLLLCKYGIEYVDDPKTKKKIPTCHRTIDDSIFEDTDYKYIIKNSYGEALELYQKEAKKINEIQKGILKISNKEEPYDIFICYKETDDKGERTRDSVIAEDIYEDLVKEGYKVFFSRITLEDKLGEEYEPYIYSALKTSKVMLVIGTKEENFNAVWVKNEWSRYLEFMKKDKSKYLIPVYSKIDVYKLPESFSMLQAQNMDKVGAKQDLIRGIKKIINIKGSNKKEISDDMYDRLQEMIKEAEKLQTSETIVLKENFNCWYIIATCLISLLMIFFTILDKSIAIGDIFVKAILISEIVVIVAAFSLGGINRKTQRISKYMYLVILLLEIIYIVRVVLCRFTPTFIDLIFLILNLVLLFITPKWKVKTSIKLLTKDKAKEIQKRNEKIEKNFDPYNRIKNFNFYMIRAFGLTLILIFVIFIFSFKFKYSFYVYKEPSKFSQVQGALDNFSGVVEEYGKGIKGSGCREIWITVKYKKNNGYICIPSERR